MRSLYYLIIITILFITGCSKDDSTNPPSTPEPEPQESQLLTGKFIDSDVEGLNYSTPTRDGVTNAAGEFEYLEGEEVTFIVGNILLGSAIGNSIITPIEIASTSNASLESLEVKNISAFLQTLDSDKTPSNGISISQEAIAFLPEGQIDFSSNIIEALGNFVSDVNQNTLADLEVVMPEEAAIHLAQSLSLDYTPTGLESGPFFNIIENWETISRNVMWIHEFDNEGKIIESNCYEKYPLKPILKYSYSNYNDNGFPESFTSTHIPYDGSEGSIWWHFYIDYDNYSKITKLQYTSNFSSSYLQGWTIDEISNKNQVLKYTVIDSEPTSFISEYYSTGRLKSRSQVKNGNTEVFEEWSYEASGELKLQSRKFGENFQSYSTRDHQYDSDYFLDQLTRVHAVAGNPVKTNIHFYDDQEKETRMEEYVDDFLTLLIETNFDESLRKSTYFNVDGSYYIKYENFNEPPYKTEYYDSDGNLISTEEH